MQDPKSNKTSVTKISREKGLFSVVVNGEKKSKITARMKPFAIDKIKPENFFMNVKLTRSQKGILYVELLYLDEGKWVRPIISLPEMKDCRLYTNAFNISTITGNLLSSDVFHRKTAERIRKIHNRVETIIKHHPMLKDIKGGFPITRFLREKEDGDYAITAEVELKRVQGNYTFNGTTFLDKNGNAMKGDPIANLKGKNLDVIMAIDISFINLSEKQEGIYNKIKLDTVKVKEIKEIEEESRLIESIGFSSDDDSDNIDGDDEVFSDEEELLEEDDEVAEDEVEEDL